MYAAPQPHLWVVGLSQLALPQEQLEIPPSHERQQHHGLLSVLCAHMTYGQQISRVGNTQKHRASLLLIRTCRLFFTSQGVLVRVHASDGHEYIAKLQKGKCYHNADLKRRKRKEWIAMTTNFST